MPKVLFCSFAFLCVLSARATSNPGQERLKFESAPTAADWASLNTTVGGRLFEGVPLAQPCYTKGFNSAECLDVRSIYLDEGLVAVDYR